MNEPRNWLRRAANGLVPVALALHGTIAAATPTTLFSGTGTPEQQGWTVSTSLGSGNICCGGTVPPGTLSVTPQSTGSASDALTVETGGGPAIHTYRINPGPGAFLASIRVAVATGSNNFADAGFFFSGIYMLPLANSPDRANSIYINPGEIGFMNSGLTPDQIFSYSLDATIFREYAILYSSSHLMQIFVDASFDDILSGLVSPVLSRQMYSDRSYPGFGDALNDWNNYQIGVISFGDQTNDSYVNSRYSVDFVKYQSLGSLGPLPPGPSVGVPEPATLALVGIALFGFSVSRSRWRGRFRRVGLYQ